MSRPIGTFQGDSLYLDTNTFYLFLRAVTPEVHSLFRNIRQGTFQAYTSALTFDELACGILSTTTATFAAIAIPAQLIDH